MLPVVSFVGKSNSGKTTLVEKLIPELKKRGYKIGVIKHSFHGFDIDQKGKDSWRHKNAGADAVMVKSSDKIGFIKDCQKDSLDDLLKYFEGMDLVITEGFKKADKPKIEIFRRAVHQEPLWHPGSHDIVAIVTDDDIDVTIDRFGLDDIKELADFIENRFL